VTARAVTQVDLVSISAERLRGLVGHLPGLGSYLQEAHRKLAGAKDELDDFLNRW
jgi:CRP-like cAMP-binding protein